MSNPGVDVPDLLAATAALVAVRSVSRDERELADSVEARLRSSSHLLVDRVGDNVVARTMQGRSTRLVLGGHLDTVPANGNDVPRIEGEVLWGLGAADMKAGLAVMLALAERHAEPALDVTYVFYAREEIAASESGLIELHDARPDLLAGDVAILGEPTDGWIEAGCQGVLRMLVTLGGVRAHAARPWMGRNAIHRAGRLLSVLDAHESRRPEILGCRFREALLATRIEGGVAGNVVPDRVALELVHRFAPDRDADAAEAAVRDLLAPLLEDGDRIEVVDRAAAARPALDHPVVAALVERGGLEVRAKLGWTDVARFAEWGVPAVNFGPGSSTLAHSPEERVDRASLEAVYASLDGLLSADAGAFSGPESTEPVDSKPEKGGGGPSAPADSETPRRTGT